MNAIPWPHLKLHVGTQSDGKTVLRSGYSRFPLRHSPASYRDDRSVMNCYVTNSCGAMFGGETLTSEVYLDPSARLRLGAVSATIVHRAQSGPSEERFSAILSENSYCELLRRPLIPTSGTHYRQRSHIQLAAGAIMIIAESLLPGRWSSDDRHAYVSLNFDLDVYNSSMRLVSERTRLEPMTRLTSLRGPAGWKCMGTLYCLGVGRNWDPLEMAMAEILADFPGAGVGSLPNGAGLMSRVLSDRCSSALDLMEKLLASVRRHIGSGVHGEVAA